MLGVRVPVPVWFAAAAFSLLLLNPEPGSANAFLAASLKPCHADVDAMHDAAYWQGYRAASRQWSQSNSNHVVPGVIAAPVVLR
jgi:hypothetical protein